MTIMRGSPWRRVFVVKVGSELHNMAEPFFISEDCLGYDNMLCIMRGLIVGCGSYPKSLPSYC